MNKKRVARTVRNTGIGVVVIVVLLLSAGIAYTWFMGRQSTASDSTSQVVAQKTSTAMGPHIPADDAAVGIAVSYLTSPVSAGSSASMTVKTNAYANCVITATYNDKKIPSKDSGLVPQKADEYGLASWTWTVDSTAPKGKWPVEVTCSNRVKSGYAKSDLVVD